MSADSAMLPLLLSALLTYTCVPPLANARALSPKLIYMLYSKRTDLPKHDDALIVPFINSTELTEYLPI